ncbi:MAG TPA: hypothetical protein VHE35_19275 [Kofleriaceae bacterium]|nr:hypothetical protein [Kofleriaceae bacterium]
MRATALATAFVFTVMTVSVPRARAGECYVDSDCPTGMVCNSAGGCVVPEGNSNGGGTHHSPTAMLLGAVVLGVVVIAILLPAMQATKEAGGVRARVDDPQLRHASLAPAPQSCGLTLRF